MLGRLAIARRHGLVLWIDRGAEGVSAGTDGAVSVVDDPVGNLERGGEVLLVAGFDIELRQRHARPRLVAYRTGIEEEREGRRSNECPATVSGFGIHEVRLSETAIGYGKVGLLRVDQPVAEHFSASNVSFSAAQQVGMNGNCVVVCESRGHKAILIGIALNQAGGFACGIGVHHEVEEAEGIPDRSCVDSRVLQQRVCGARCDG